MAVGFAGSRTLDERRRRRLAGGPEEREPGTESGSSAGVPTRHAEERTCRNSGDASRRGDGRSSSIIQYLPLRRIVSPRLWKHLLVALTGGLVGAGILAGGTTVTGGSGLLRAELNRLFVLPDGPLVRCYIGLLLLLAGQLALLIRWGRSRSDSDFAGRYRVWGWVAAVWFLSAFAMAVDVSRVVHAAASQFNSTNLSSIWWFAPSLGGGLLLYRTLHREMRASRSSLTMLQAACGCILLAGTTAVPGAAVAGPVVRTGLLMAASLALFLSMLLHARHVIYVSVDAPAVPPLRARLRLWKYRCRRLRAILGRVGATIRRVIRLPRTSERKSSRSTTHQPSNACDDKDVKHQPASSMQAEPTEARTQVQPKPPRQDSGSGGESNVRDKEPDAQDTRQPESSGKKHRADPPVDKDQLKGLSKRERRKLRKKRREQQRASGKGP